MVAKVYNAVFVYSVSFYAFFNEQMYFKNSFSMIALSFAVAEMVGENMGNDNLRKGFWDPKQASIPTTHIYRLDL